MWTCSKCGERVEDDFEVCWSCGTTIDGVEDPDFFSPEKNEPRPMPPAGDVPEHLVTITSCSLPAQALALRLQLEAAGVPVFLADEYTISMDWLLSNAIGGIKVQVAQDDVPRACDVLGIEVPAPKEEYQDDPEDEEDEQFDEGEDDEMDNEDEPDDDGESPA